MRRTFPRTASGVAFALLVALLGYAVPAAAQTTESEAPPADAAAPDSTTADDPATTADEALAADDAAAPGQPADAALDAQISSDATGNAQSDANQAQLDATAAAQADLQGAAQPQADLQGPADLTNQATIEGQAQVDTSAQPSIQTQPDASIQADAQADIDAQADVNGQRAADNLGVQFGAATARGLPINTIERNSVFLNSGLRPRDVLVSVSGQPVRSFVEFQRFATLYPGQRIPLVVLREGRPQTIYFTLPANYSFVRPRPGYPLPGNNVARAFLGVTFDSRFADAAIVRSVNPGSPAEQAGLRPGDRINALNGRGVRVPEHVVQIVSQMQPGERVDISFSRRAAAVLGGQPQPHTVGYAPQPAPVVTAPAVVPNGAFVPDVDRRPLNDNVVRPGDVDRDGRVFDGDGRIRRRDRQ